ncbi:mannosyltransferase, partial [Leucobacter soli]
MATLTLIGEPFPDCEAAAHAEGARELTRAVAETAPRGCSARLLVASDRPAPAFENARASTERLPLNATMLPVLWRTGVTARPLDGEMVHAITPLVALRARGEDDGSQSSVMVPHALGWLAPEAMGAATARQYRAFVKRAVKHADVVLTPTHATASALQERFGTDIVVQVLPLAAPPSFLPAGDSADRRTALGLPARYLVTTAVPGEAGRLEWLLQTLASDPSLPPLVVLVGSMPAEHAVEQTHETGGGDSGRGGAAP